MIGYIIVTSIHGKSNENDTVFSSNNLFSSVSDDILFPMDDWSKGTTEYHLKNVYFDVPSEWGVLSEEADESIGFYVVLGDEPTIFSVSLMDKNVSLTESQYRNFALDEFKTSKDEFSVISTSDGFSSSGVRYSQAETTYKNDETLCKEIFSFCLTEEKCLIAFLQSPKSSLLDFSSDYDKIIDSIRILDSEPAVNSSPDPSSSSEQANSVQTNDIPQNEIQQSEEPPASTEEEQTAAPVQNTEGNITTGQKNALSSASQYLSFSSFSRSGLIDQLEYEGFSNEEAVYAVDHCGANWKEQSAESAKSYLRVSSFSYDGLVDQLEYEGFTSEEATYGVDRCGADWNEQAAASAKSYLELMPFSRQELIDQLLYEGFTQSQAEYGVSQNGY